jgi:hypothetical protein
MENTEPVMPADGRPGDVPELGDALEAIVALGPAAVPPGYVGETLRDGVEHLQRIANDMLVAHLNGGDETVKAAFRALRISAEVIIETMGSRVYPGDGTDEAEQTTGITATAEAGAETGGDAGREQEAAGRRALSAQECVSATLRDLWERLAADQETATLAADYRLADDLGRDPADLARQRWERLHLMCLRITSESAERWREEACRQISATLRENGHEPAPIHPAECGPVAGQPQIPSLPEIRYPGTAPLTADGGLPEQLAKQAEGLDERWIRLARYAAVAYWLDEHDPQLYGGLAGVHTTDRGLTPPGTRSEAYRSTLIDRVGDLATEHTDDRTELSRAVSVDEAIRGLVPIPFPAPGSWWDVFNIGLAEMLTKHLPGASFVPVTRVPFATVSGRVEKESPQLAPELVRKYRLAPGVVWVLRLGYPEHVIPGRSKPRVVYVSSG